MLDPSNLLARTLRRIRRYSVRRNFADDGAFLEEQTEISINANREFETVTSIALSILDCGHAIRHYSEIGGSCFCGTLHCQNFAVICERCLTLSGRSCCTKVFEGGLYCVHCYRVVKAKQGAVLAGRETGKALFAAGKVLLIPFKRRE